MTGVNYGPSIGLIDLTLQYRFCIFDFYGIFYRDDFECIVMLVWY